jgi:hypothetical protein
MVAPNAKELQVDEVYTESIVETGALGGSSMPGLSGLR